MGKFKAGFKVRSLVTQIDVRAGELYEVKTVENGGVWVIDGVGDEFYLTSDEFEILPFAQTFKVGDRVRATDKSGGLIVGETYTVSSYASSTAIGRWVNLEGRRSNYSNDGSFLESSFELAPLKIEAGKYYRTRDGRKAGPLMARNNDSYAFAADIAGDIGIRIFQKDGVHGSRWIGNEPNLDLVAEWVDEPVKAAAKPTLKRGDKVKVTVDRPEYGLLEGDLGTLLEDDTDTAPFILWARTSDTWAISNDDLELVTEVEDSPNEEVTAETAIKTTLLKTNQGYGFEIARHGDYVWVDTGKKAPIVLKANDVQAAA